MLPNILSYIIKPILMRQQNQSIRFQHNVTVKKSDAKKEPHADEN
jgi:hypothetical protein